MKATVPWTSAVLATALTASLASAQTYCSPVLNVPLQVGPDACGPGFYTVCRDGSAFGPNYWLRPDTGPFNGYYKTVSCAAGQQIMATHLGIPHPGMPYAPPGYYPAQ